MQDDDLGVIDTADVDDDPGYGREARASSRRQPVSALGPGLVAGAANDDPSSIATYSQAGAQFAFGLSWVLLVTYPLVTSVQMVSAEIGRATGHGLAGNLRLHYPAVLVAMVVPIVLIVNIVTIGADLGAMADATSLVLGGARMPWVLVFAAVCVALQLSLRYARYVALLKRLALVLFAYVATLLLLDVPWGDVARSLVVPRITWSRDYLTAIVAVFGTTISPYLLFWQASLEAETVAAGPRPPVPRTRGEPSALRRIGIDTMTGMGIANVIGLSIMITTAVTLHAGGVTDIETSAQAAAALRPIAGAAAEALFALGIVGTGLLAVPAFAGSAAYAVGEARRWPVGLSRRLRDAKAFYVTIALATATGTVSTFTPIDPIKALYWCAVLNGVAAVPIMATMMAMASNAKVMGPFVIKPWLAAWGWLATGLMAVIAVAMIVCVFV